MERLAKVIGDATQFGVDLGDIPDPPTEQWLGEKEGLIEALRAQSPEAQTGAEPAADLVVEDEPEPGNEPQVDSNEEPAAEEPTPEAAEEPTPEAAEEPTPEAAEEPTPEAAEEPTPEAAEEPAPVNQGGSPSGSAASPLAAFIPDTNLLIPFGIFAVNGGIWASVLGLELITRDSVDGFRGVFLLSWVVTIILAMVCKKFLSSLPEGEGNELKQNGLQSALKDFMIVMLGTISGVALGLAFSGHGTELAATMKVGSSAGSAIGVLVGSLLCLSIVNGAWKGQDKSPIGGAGLAVFGLGFLAIGAMSLMALTGVVDSVMAVVDAFSAANNPLNLPDMVTMIGYSPVFVAFRGLALTAMQIAIGAGLVFLGLGMLLAGMKVMQKASSERAAGVGLSYMLCGNGFSAIAVFLGLGQLLLIDAVFTNIGAGPTTLKTCNMMLFAFFLFPHTRTLRNAFLSFRPKAVLIMRGK
jgi:hypothetical protein